MQKALTIIRNVTGWLGLFLMVSVVGARKEIRELPICGYVIDVSLVLLLIWLITFNIVDVVWPEKGGIDEP